MIEDLAEALADGWGDEDFFGWPERADTDCTDGGRVHSTASQAIPLTAPSVQEFPLAEARVPFSEDASCA
jgi:hypothetical protein